MSADSKDLVEISFYDAVQASTVEKAAEMQDRINEDYVDGSSIHWGIEDRLSGQIVGTCGYYRGFDKGQGELGCVLLPQYRGKGYMAAAMQLAIAFGFDQMGLERIWAATDQDNTAAIKLLERLDFIKVGELENEIEYEQMR